MCAKKEISNILDKGKLRLQYNFGHVKATFLHGTLKIEVLEAKDLPDMDGLRGFKWITKDDVTDAYVEVRLCNASLARTKVVINDLNPTWNESYHLDVCHLDETLVFCVKDKDHARSEVIGNVEFRISDLLDGERREDWFYILKKGRLRSRGKLKLMVQFIPCHSMQNTYEVDCYFPVHHNCSVTLYQDAHTLHDMPQFKLMEPSYAPRSCWTDLYLSLMGAKHIICITGWAVWHKLKLFRQSTSTEGRDLPSIDDRTLGEILVDKTKQGVKVYIMIWSEYTSVMGTFGVETFNYFQNTEVKCALAPRGKESTDFATDILQNQFQSAGFTHHQKTVVCDAPCNSSEGRHLVAYVGGLDLHTGRWDTPNHELFSTLLKGHNGDFRNKMANVKPTEGPREPWHDIHSKLEGSIAHDVFINFRERWDKQGLRDNEKTVEVMTLDDKFFDLQCCTSKEFEKRWSCQLFRSITEDSAEFDDKRTSKLNSKMGRYIDQSIVQAYIQMIRNAEHFLYIENQYFLGSSYCWLKHRNVNCQHTIPAEITQKIVYKIEKGERFAAYIVIPMFPEGDPTSAAVQEILYWQYHTIEMMYNRIGKAIKDSGSNTVPTDWLIFMCLGKNEASSQGSIQTRDRETRFRKTAGAKLYQDTIARKTSVFSRKTSQQCNPFLETLRFPIYVHSKLMIVDDAYVIVGSANINQRSIAGTRDTEIAVGCWQPHFIANKPYGDVHIFRLSLFSEHFNHFDPIFKHPAEIECVRKVKDMIKYNWKMYLGHLDQFLKEYKGVHISGNMLPYLIDVKSDGTLHSLDGITSFPDFPPHAAIKGRLSKLPQQLTC